MAWFGLAVLLASHAASAAPADPPDLATLDPGRFTQPTRIDNKFMPMRPGTRLVYEGVTVEDDGKVVPHRLEVVTTNLVKQIGGVLARVTYDRDETDGEVVEAEIAFYAQDAGGNVWLLGEYPEEYEDGQFTKAPAWVHGAEGARAGLMMLHDPKPGTPSYSEGWGPSVGWTDRGMVHEVGTHQSVPAGDYRDVLVVKEKASAEPDAEQLKFYAPDVGNIRVGWVGDEKKTRETLELVRVDRLDDAAMRRVDEAARALDKRAYERTPRAYAHTAPVTAEPAAP